MKKATEVSFGLLFSIAVIGLALMAITAIDRTFVGPSTSRNTSTSTNMSPCWVLPTQFETNGDSILMTFRMPTTNYNGAIIFGRKSGNSPWIHEGVLFDSIRTQHVVVSVYRELRLLIIPPERAEWREIP